jgi:hypothetical protein
MDSTIMFSPLIFIILWHNILVNFVIAIADEKRVKNKNDILYIVLELDLLDTYQWFVNFSFICDICYQVWNNLTWRYIDITLKNPR